MVSILTAESDISILIPYKQVKEDRGNKKAQCWSGKTVKKLYKVGVDYFPKY